MSELKTRVAYRDIPKGVHASTVDRQFAVPTVACIREPGFFVPNMARIYRTDLRLVDGHVVTSRSALGESSDEAPFVYLVEIPRFSTREVQPLSILGYALLTDADITTMSAAGGSLALALEWLETA